MDAERLQKTVRAMRKGLRDLAGEPRPEQVHKLRTRAREIEAVAAALMGDGRRTRALRRAMKRVRLAAGKVRDADVLTAHALKLASEIEQDATTRLLQSLKALRRKNATELLRVLERKRKSTCRKLKRFAAQLQAGLERGGSSPKARNLEANLRRATKRVTDELSRWPTLSKENLHRFRLRLKELRLLLGLNRSASPELVHAINIAKDQIGDWHDWQKLRKMAGNLLDAETDQVILSEIEKAIAGKLAQALAASNALRKHFLNGGVLRKVAA